MTKRPKVSPRKRTDQLGLHAPGKPVVCAPQPSPPRVTTPKCYDTVGCPSDIAVSKRQSLNPSSDLDGDGQLDIVLKWDPVYDTDMPSCSADPVLSRGMASKAEWNAAVAHQTVGQNIKSRAARDAILGVRLPTATASRGGVQDRTRPRRMGRATTLKTGASGRRPTTLLEYRNAPRLVSGGTGNGFTVFQWRDRGGTGYRGVSSALWDRCECSCCLGRHGGQPVEPIQRWVSFVSRYWKWQEPRPGGRVSSSNGALHASDGVCLQLAGWRADQV